MLISRSKYNFIAFVIKTLQGTKSHKFFLNFLKSVVRLLLPESHLRLYLSDDVISFIASARQNLIINKTTKIPQKNNICVNIFSSYLFTLFFLSNQMVTIHINTSMNYEQQKTPYTHCVATINHCFTMITWQHPGS